MGLHPRLSKTRIILLAVLCVLLGIHAWYWLRPIVLSGRDSNGPTPVQQMEALLVGSDLWQDAEGVLPGRMRTKLDGISVHRAVWQRPDGEFLVCAVDSCALPCDDPIGRAVLGGSTYHILVLNRQMRVVRRGTVRASMEEDEPYCLAEIRTASEEVPAELRGRWLLAIGFWWSGWFRYVNVLEPPLDRVAGGHLSRTRAPSIVDLEAVDWADDEHDRVNLDVVGPLQARWSERKTGPLPEILRATTKHTADPTPDDRFLGAALAELEKLPTDEQLRNLTYFVTERGEGPPRMRRKATQVARARMAELMREKPEPESWQEAVFADAMIVQRFLWQDATPWFRHLLHAKEPHLATLAAVSLTLWRDEEAIPDLVATYQRLTGHSDLRHGVWAMAQWGDLRLIPALIALLEDDGPGQGGGAWYSWPHKGGPPPKKRPSTAIYARNVLFDLTGCWFPFNVAEGQEIWEGARERNEADPLVYLRSVLPSEKQRLSAVADLSTDNSVSIIVSNASSAAVHIPRRATEVEYSYSPDQPSEGSPITDPGGYQHSHYDYRPPEDAFVRIDGGGTHSFKLRRKLDGARLASMTLCYLWNATPYGFEAWQGVIECPIRRATRKLSFEVRPGKVHWIDHAGLMEKLVAELRKLKTLDAEPRTQALTELAVRHGDYSVVGRDLVDGIVRLALVNSAGGTALDDLDKPDSEFSRILAGAQPGRDVIVFTIREGAERTYWKARSIAEDMGFVVRTETGDRGLSFQLASGGFQEAVPPGQKDRD